jgi:hypothetical protein
MATFYVWVGIFDNYEGSKITKNIGCRPSGFESLSLRHKRKNNRKSVKTDFAVLFFCDKEPCPHL